MESGGGLHLLVFDAAVPPAGGSEDLGNSPPAC